MRSRVYKKRLSQSGVLLVTTVVVLLVLSVISLALVETMRRESQILKASIQYYNAETVAITGMERAIKFLAEVGDWTNTPTTLYNNIPFGGGTYTVTTSNASRDSVRLRSRGVYQSASYAYGRDLTI